MIQSLLTLFLLSSAVPTSAKIPEDYAATIIKEGKTVSHQECSEMESKIGQLLYITVDGFGSNFTVHPDYFKLVKRIQPGGVLPHYNSGKLEEIKKANAELQSNSALPLMIGIDYQNIGKTRIGLGYGAGIAGDIGEQPPECYARISRIDAALHRYAGINHPLGPTIENASQWGGILTKDLNYKIPRLQAITKSFHELGLETTLKHYPYTPENFNLHQESRDTNIPMQEVNEKYLPVFREMSNDAGFVMTTHLFNSQVDPDNMATFSPLWIKKLREEIGFNGIVMTDALFMIESYADTMKQMARDWPFQDSPEMNNDNTIFAVKAILAGHDMIFLATAATETEKQWKNLVKFSCGNNTAAARFRERVRESEARISRYKKANDRLRKIQADLSQTEIEELLNRRGKIKETCSEDFSKIETILQKIAAIPPRIDREVFPCVTSSSEQVSSLVTQLLALESNLDNEITPFLAIQAVSSPDLTDVTFAQSFFRKHPQLLPRLRPLLVQQLQSNQTLKMRQALHIMSTLELWNNDSSFIDEAVKNADERKILAYFDALETGTAPLLSPALREQGMNFLKQYLQKHPLNLVKATELPSRVKQMINMFLPPSLARELSPEKLAALNLPEDMQVLLMLGQALRTDHPKLKALRRFFILYVSNPQFRFFKLPMEYCEKTNAGKCENYVVTHASVKSLQSILFNRQTLHDQLNAEDKKTVLATLSLVLADPKTKDPQFLSELRLLRIALTNNQQDADDFLATVIKTFTTTVQQGDSQLKMAQTYDLGQKLQSLESFSISPKNNEALLSVLKENWDTLFPQGWGVESTVAQFLMNNRAQLTDTRFAVIMKQIGALH